MQTSKTRGKALMGIETTTDSPRRRPRRGQNGFWVPIDRNNQLGRKSSERRACFVLKNRPSTAVTGIWENVSKGSKCQAIEEGR